MALQDIDLLAETAVSLQDKLSSGSITSEQLVLAYLDQIEAHNHKGLHLNAVISVAPREQLRSQVAALDKERRDGRMRGPLHGIPSLVKDNIMTISDLGMDTTCGCFALKGVGVKKNAAVVELYLDAGMIIIGKANLSVSLPALYRSPDGQIQLETALGDTLSDEQYAKARKHVREIAKNKGFDRIFAKIDVDVLVSLLDCRVGSMAAAAGYLHGAVPLGYADRYNGRAYGLTVVAGAGREDKALEFMSTWEVNNPGLRKPPPQLTGQIQELGWALVC